jgi:hypothetical protein
MRADRDRFGDDSAISYAAVAKLEAELNSKGARSPPPVGSVKGKHIPSSTEEITGLPKH